MKNVPNFNKFIRIKNNYEANDCIMEEDYDIIFGWQDDFIERYLHTKDLFYDLVNATVYNKFNEGIPNINTLQYMYDDIQNNRASEDDIRSYMAGVLSYMNPIVFEEDIVIENSPYRPSTLLLDVLREPKLDVILSGFAYGIWEQCRDGIGSLINTKNIGIAHTISLLYDYYESANYNSIDEIENIKKCLDNDEYTKLVVYTAVYCGDMIGK